MPARPACACIRLAAALGFGFAAAGVLCTAAEPARASERRQSPTVKIVQQAGASIVNIHGQKTLAPGDENYRRGETQNVNGMGTGVVIDERGYVLTNNHVVDGVKRIEVTLSDKEEYVATRVAHDPKTDLAIIKINNSKLPVINIGTSSDLMTGEEVVAVGNAYGYEHTVTRGIISALHRTVQVSETQSYSDLIQTDASINPGNSGGPLLNIDGEMIGINVAVRAGAQGIGFAIPVDMAVAVAAELMCAERERAENTWHGIVSRLSASPTERFCIVGEVDDASPAAKCGLQPGDIIARIGDNPVARPLDLERALLGHRVGEEFTLSVHRGQQPVKVNLVLASAPKKSTDAERAWETLGMRLEPVGAAQLRGYRKQYRGGLLVTSVRRDGPAARDGIRQGDILLGIHIWESISMENVIFILGSDEFAKLDEVKFLILRNEATYYGHLSTSTRR
ncbi:MAG: trypsin-like peptidase domain-containing protein [Pirellulales bacterium]